MAQRLQPPRPRGPADRRGVTTVEFALAFPLLLVMLFGMLEVLRMSNLRHTADNAAYEAARNVIVPGASAADAKTKANDLLKRTGVKNGKITVNPSVIGEQTDRVTVKVEIPLVGNSWLPPKLTKARTVTREVTLMTERVPVVQARAVPVPPPPPTPPLPHSHPPASPLPPAAPVPPTPPAPPLPSNPADPPAPPACPGAPEPPLPPLPNRYPPGPPGSPVPGAPLAPLPINGRPNPPVGAFITFSRTKSRICNGETFAASAVA